MSFGRYKIDENTLNNYDDKRVSIFFFLKMQIKVYSHGYETYNKLITQTVNFQFYRGRLPAEF